MKFADRQIMLIDDDEVLRTLLTRVLTVAGCTVQACSSIKEALGQLKSSTPDLVILDLNMPEFDGFAFLKIRFQNKILSAIPVLVLSGTKNKADVQRALELGADQFVEKPLESRIILQKLRYIFSSKSQQVYRFPAGSSPSVEAEIQGVVVQQAIGRLRVESQAKFHPGKSLQISVDQYLKASGQPLVCKIDDAPTELNDGFYRTLLSVVGMEPNEKKHFESWQKSLSRGSSK